MSYWAFRNLISMRLLHFYGLHLGEIYTAPHKLNIAPPYLLKDYNVQSIFITTFLQIYIDNQIFQIFRQFRKFHLHTGDLTKSSLTVFLVKFPVYFIGNFKIYVIFHRKFTIFDTGNFKFSVIFIY